jgi:hypothetical protein
MNKDQIFPLVFGLVLGILLMFFWNLGASLNNQNLRLRQLEQAADANNQTITEVVNFINSAVSPEGQEVDNESPLIIE